MLGPLYHLIRVGIEVLTPLVTERQSPPPPVVPDGGEEGYREECLGTTPELRRSGLRRLFCGLPVFRGGPRCFRRTEILRC